MGEKKKGAAIKINRKEKKKRIEKRHKIKEIKGKNVFR